MINLGDQKAVEGPAATARPMARRDVRFVILKWFRELTLVPVIVVLMIAGALVNPVFFTTSNLINVAEGGAALGMVVVAESLILLTGKFDISLQGTFGLAALLGAWLIAPKASEGLGTQWSPWLGLAIVLLVGLAVGTFNGLLVIKANFNAFIFTLAMSILLTGLQLGWLGGQTVYNLPEAYIYIGPNRGSASRSRSGSRSPPSSWRRCSCAITGSAGRCTPSVATSRPPAPRAYRSTESGLACL